MKPLEGIKVIDLTRFVAGPHCTLVLSDLGAEVIKIEKCGLGDDLRLIGPKLLNTSLWSAVLNRGKKSLELNLKSKEGRVVLIKLIKEADVLVENFRPGVMEKLHLGWKEVKSFNDKIIMARISGYGQDDSKTSRQAFDATIQAETGFMQISGHDSKPTMIGTVFLDYTTGLNTAIGILAALNARNITNKGDLVETSLVSSALSLSMDAVPNYFLRKVNFTKNGNSDRFSSPSNTYKAKNGFIHIMAGSDDRFYGLLKSMKREDLYNSSLYNNSQKRLKKKYKIDKLVNSWTKKHSIKSLAKLLSKNSVPYGEIKSFSQFLRTKTARNNLIKAKLNNKNITVPECAIRVRSDKGPLKRIIPSVGKNNNELLRGLGYDKKAIVQLKEKKVIN